MTKNDLATTLAMALNLANDLSTRFADDLTTSQINAVNNLVATLSADLKADWFDNNGFTAKRLLTSK